MSIKICEHCEGEGRYPEGSTSRIRSAGKEPDQVGYALLQCPYCNGNGKFPKKASK